MRVWSLLPLLFVTVPVTVSACEGNCIVGITDAFIGNYTAPVNTVTTSIVRSICTS